MIRLGSIGARLQLGSKRLLRVNVLPITIALGSRAQERVRIAYAWPPSAAVVARLEPVTYRGEPVTYRGEPVVVRVQ